MPRKRRSRRVGSLTAFPAGPSRMRPGTQTWREILTPLAVVAGLAAVWWAITKIPIPPPKAA